MYIIHMIMYTHTYLLKYYIYIYIYICIHTMIMPTLSFMPYCLTITRAILDPFIYIYIKIGHIEDDLLLIFKNNNLNDTL